MDNKFADWIEFDGLESWRRHSSAKHIYCLSSNNFLELKAIE